MRTNLAAGNSPIAARFQSEALGGASLSVFVGPIEHPMSKRPIDIPGKGLIQFDDVSGSVRGAILV